MSDSYDGNVNTEIVVVAGCLEADDLPPLTLVESLLVAPLRAFRMQVYLKARCAPQHRQTALRGHVVAFPNPAPSALAGCFPMSLDDIPTYFNVVLIAAAGSVEEAREKARRSKVLRVRGRVVVKWARHIAAVLEKRPHLAVDIRLNESALAAYERMGDGGVPEQLVHNIVYTEDDDEASTLRRVFMADRQGYAAQRTGAAMDPLAVSTCCANHDESDNH